ncbi:MAG: PAS domain S-box protein [Nitrospirae bacterium]|nr:PAS domain S-box protein [Nitrospirota bacterium]
MKESSTVWKKALQSYGLPSAVLFLGIFAFFLFLLGAHLTRLQYTDSLFIDAAMDIEINTSLAHFLIEEASDANADMDIREVTEHIDEAIHLTDSILNGGETEHGLIKEPLSDPEMRAYAEAVRLNLIMLKTEAPKHVEAAEKPGIDWAVDQKINALVLEIIKDAEKIDDLIGVNRKREWEEYRQLFIGVLVLWAFGITTATFGLLRHEWRRKQVLAELTKSGENLNLYQTLIDQSNDSIELVDPETGNFLDVNRKACEDLGYSREEFLSLKVFDIDPVVKPSDFTTIMDSLRRTGSGIWDSVHLRKDGSTFPVEVSLKFVQLDRSYLVAVARDVTKRKGIEDTLRESEELYADLFNGMLEGFALHKIICDENGRPVDYRFLKINPAFERLTGLRAADLIGRTVLEVLPDTEPFWIETYGRVALTGEPIHFSNYSAELDKYFMVTAYSPRHEQFVAIFEDITGRKQAEKERDHLNEQVKERNKELQQIVYTISHDLRSPLINIQGYCKLLTKSLQEAVSSLEGENISQGVKEKIASIIEKDISESKHFIFLSIHKIDSMLSGLLSFSRSMHAEIRKEEIDMNSLVSNVVSAIDFQVRDSGAKIEIADLPSCFGDNMQINQVFSNLIGNSIKFLSPERPGAISISGRKEDGQAVYCVEDNGIGIAPEDQGKIFEVFQRLHPEEVKGEGIGLSIVSKILERHNGKVWVESELGKGSRFYVALPT